MINCLSVEVVYLYYLDKSLLDVAIRLSILTNGGGAAANSAAAFVAVL